jgi:hypothetical protein
MAERSCACPDWPKRARDPFFPVWYNEKMNEYIIISGEIAANSLVVYFCPSCGGRMPKSRRGEFFTIPTDTELAEARTILEGINDVSSMYALLGEPDDVCDWFTDEHGKPLRNPDGATFRCQYTYKSRWKTLRVVIQEWENSELVFYFYGQPKNAESARGDPA